MDFWVIYALCRHSAPQEEESAQIAHTGSHPEQEEVRRRNKRHHELREPGLGRREIIDVVIEQRGQDQQGQGRNP